MNDFLTPYFLDILVDPASKGLILAGGYGLYLKRAHVIRTGLRTLLPELPATRATSDLDFFLKLEVFHDPDQGKAISPGSEQHSTAGLPAKKAGGRTVAEQAVIVSFQYSGKTLDDLYALEDRLTHAIQSAGAGEFDGDEIATDGMYGTLYMYGPDADALFAVVKPLLQASASLVKPVATVRYGPPGHGTRARVVTL